MSYSGVFVFGDSLVDAGNALKLAEFADDIPLVGLPNGVPTSEKGYYDGRFTNGFTFADLVSNKFLSVPTSTVFPFGYSDPVLGISFPFASEPDGNNLNFAYGGAQIEQGGEVVPDLDDQVDAFVDAVDGQADPAALHLVTVGGNDVRRLVPDSGAVATAATARATLTDAATEFRSEVVDLIEAGVRHLVVTGIPNVGIVPEYNGLADEAARRAAATEYSALLDGMIQQHLAELRVQFPQATIHYVSLANASAEIIANLDRIFAPEALEPLHQPSDILFFDKVHPTAQSHALLASFVLDAISGSSAGEVYALTAPDHRVEGSIAVAGEVDTIVLSLAANTSYTFEMLGLSSGSGTLADPLMRIVGPGGVPIGGDDDGGLGLDSSLRFVTRQAGDYVFELTGAGGLSGSYKFQYAAEEAGDGASPITYVGGPSTDLFTGGVADDQASGAGANDTLRGGGGNDKLYGDDGADSLHGDDGNDLLDGGAGLDVLDGGLGDDIYVSDGDTLIEGPGGGTDTVLSSVTHSLGIHFENITLTGTAYQAAGNDRDNILVGNAAANRLYGAAGADQMSGGAGDDSYQVDDQGDVVVEAAGEGVDSVQSDVTYRLTDNVENLTLISTVQPNGTRVDQGIEGYGNTLANRIAGNTANNIIGGGGGNDVLIGGAGSDRFLFNSTLNALTNVDVINDFAAVDSIVLDRTIFAGISGAGSLEAAAFVVGSAAADADDRIVYDQAGGNVYYDADGNGAAAKLLFARVNAGTVLTAANFSAIDGGTPANFEPIGYRGTEFDNIFMGGLGNDRAFGNGGNDTLSGGGGNDTLDGGLGNDRIEGGAGNDQANGGGGDDSLAGLQGDDALDGGAGQDSALYSGARDSYDVIKLGGGALKIAGPEGTDLLSNVERLQFGASTYEVPSTFFAAAHQATQTFGRAPAAGGWTDGDTFPRTLADINGDGLADIVGFGNAGVYAALATGDGTFGKMYLAKGEFGVTAGGWTNSNTYPRMLADINGDGLADVVGFGQAGVYAALANGNGGFGKMYLAKNEFGVASGWTSSDAYPRTLADVNGDGRADLVGFGHAGVYVSLATGNGAFGKITLAKKEFGAGAGGWTDNDDYPRMLADINGDGLADLVGFGQAGVYASLATGNGTFGKTYFAKDEFGAADGWTDNDAKPRMLADINGDGLADLIGFGADGIDASLATGNGAFGDISFEASEFSANAGWTSDNLFHRELADVNGDGLADIIGFSDTGVRVALAADLIPIA